MILQREKRHMKGDGEKCVEAGMDGRVSKPGKAKVAAIVEPVPHVKARLLDLAHQRERGILDADAALARLDGDSELFLEIAGLFVEDAPRLETQMREAIEEGDSEKLGFAAHTLKGALTNFCAPSTYEAAKELESLARQGDMIGAGKIFPSLEENLHNLLSALASYSQ